MSGKNALILGVVAGVALLVGVGIVFLSDVGPPQPAPEPPAQIVYTPPIEPPPAPPAPPEVVEAPRQPKPSKPVMGLQSGFLDIVEIPEPISLITLSVPSEPGNAGDDYAQAVQVYRDNQEEVDAFLGSFSSPPAPETLPESVHQIIRHIEQGARKASMEYVFVHTPKELGVKRFYAPADDMNAIANVMIFTGFFHAVNDDPERQIELLKAACVLGWHLYEEHAHVVMMNYGLGIQLDAAYYLAQEYKATGQDNLADDAEAYGKAVNGILNAFDEKMSLLWNTRPVPGEVFHVIENDRDRAWRIRATLSLGILRYTSTGSDHRYNARLIRRLMGDSDPMIAAAAKAANDLSIEDFNTLASDPR